MGWHSHRRRCTAAALAGCWNCWCRPTDSAGELLGSELHVVSARIGIIHDLVPYRRLLRVGESLVELDVRTRDGGVQVDLVPAEGGARPGFTVPDRLGQEVVLAGPDRADAIDPVLVALVGIRIEVQ